MKRKLLATTTLALALPLSANAMVRQADLESAVQNWWSPTRLYVGVYEGYGEVNDMIRNDGQSAIGRLAFGLDVYTYRSAIFSAELGLQNGKTMRHEPADNDPDADVDPPIQTTLNPVLDLLASARIPISADCRFYGIVKLGIAYRQLQFHEADYVSPINQISAELQFGFGYQLTPHVRATVLYQGIYSNGSVRYTQNTDTTVTVSNIPTQQAGFLGLEFTI